MNTYSTCNRVAKLRGPTGSRAAVVTAHELEPGISCSTGESKHSRGWYVFHCIIL